MSSTHKGPICSTLTHGLSSTAEGAGVDVDHVTPFSNISDGLQDWTLNATETAISKSENTGDMLLSAGHLLPFTLPSFFRDTWNIIQESCSQTSSNSSVNALSWVIASTYNPCPALGVGLGDRVCAVYRAFQSISPWLERSLRPHPVIQPSQQHPGQWAERICANC